MSVLNFNTANQTYRQLLVNGLTYRVPSFQRNYSWEQDEWDDLWNDMLGVLSEGGEPAHYMGYLVLQSKDNRSFDIIDGQQRLTTMSLFILAILKNLQALVDSGVEPDNNKIRIEQLRNTFVGYLDPVTLVARSKLVLNRNNDAFFQNHIVPLGRLPQRGLNVSENLIRKCFEWFHKRVEEKFFSLNDGAELARIIDAVTDRLFFTVITVTDELNAFKVFETLNARGVRLSATDLLKNYLFSVVHREGCHETEIKNLEDRWENLVDQMGSESFPDFLRTSWNSRNEFVRKADLFKIIRGKIIDKKAVFSLLRDMEEDAEIYTAFTRPEDQFWPREAKESLNELNLFNVRQQYSLLMAAKRSMPTEDFLKILRALCVISFRYNAIGGLPARDQETVYNKTAERIANGELTGSLAVIQSLRPVYVPDKKFENDFAEKQVKTKRNGKLVRYILFKLEKHMSGKGYDADSGVYSIEHILPENPGSQWPEMSGDEAENLVYRLGNMTLMKTTDNREVGNKSYSEKRDFYKNSEFEITRTIAEENDEWTAKRIARRQQWMARQATGVWRVPQL